MIDTVRLICIERPTQEQLEAFWVRREDSGRGPEPKVSYFYNASEALHSTFRATYRPKALQGYDQFLLEASLPKLVYANNWMLLDNLEDATAAFDAILHASEAIPPLMPTAQMSLSRLDVCCSHYVGDLMPHYVEALGRLAYSHRDTVRVNDETVEYRAKSVKTKFYDKHAETNGEAPHGLLRHEVTFHRARTIKRGLGTKCPVTLGGLTKDTLLPILENDLVRLGIHGKPFATANCAALILCEAYGRKKGGYRYMELDLLQRMSKSKVAAALHLSLSTIRRHMADIRDAGLSLALTDNEVELPPLQVTL